MFNLTKKGLAGVIATSGGLTLVLLADRLVALRGVDAALLGPIALLLFGGMVAGAVLLWKAPTVGAPIALTVLYLQAPVVQWGRLSYSVFSIPAIEIKLWPQIGLAFSTAGQLTVAWHEAAQPTYVGLNATALSLAGLLLYLYDIRIPVDAARQGVADDRSSERSG